MQVEEGKYHITRGGGRVGPVMRDSAPQDDDSPWVWTDGVLHWTAEGRFMLSDTTPLDLIAVAESRQPDADPLDAAIAKAEEELAILRRARELQRQLMGEGK